MLEMLHWIEIVAWLAGLTAGLQCRVSRHGEVCDGELQLWADRSMKYVL